ncbi:hypothetical protein AGMMS49992_15950 [Clostridia bacterium]|nr:hypothetical protein AGMMS49992_15950 [Clostridia bacterium]
MAASIKDMKGYVKKLQSESRKILDTDDDINKIQRKKSELYEAIKNDITCTESFTLIDKLNAKLDNGKGVYTDENLTEAIEKIDEEINNLQRSIAMKEKAEADMRRAEELLRQQSKVFG